MVKEMDVALLMNSIHVKTHEGGRNGNQKDGRGSLQASTNTS
jgi:hypothetical protein